MREIVAGNRTMLESLVSEHVAAHLALLPSLFFNYRNSAVTGFICHVPNTKDYRPSGKPGRVEKLERALENAT